MWRGGARRPPFLYDLRPHKDARRPLLVGQPQPPLGSAALTYLCCDAPFVSHLRPAELTNKQLLQPRSTDLVPRSGAAAGGKLQPQQFGSPGAPPTPPQLVPPLMKDGCGFWNSGRTLLQLLAPWQQRLLYKEVLDPASPGSPPLSSLLIHQLFLVSV